MKDEAALRIMERTANEVERKLNCVQALKKANQRPSPDLVEDLRVDEEFLEYLNEVITQ